MAAKVAMIVAETGASVISVAPSVGYSYETARSGKIQKTKTYKDIMARDSEQTLKRMAHLREQALKIARKKAEGAKYGELVASADTMTKNIQLLTGGATEITPILQIIHFNATQIKFSDVENPQKEAKNSENRQIPL